jgi:hypothetical protein
MDKEEITLAALLQEQEKKTLLATAEAVPGKPDMVKVTPWVPGRGCACQFAMVFQKTSIKKLTRTAHRHYCCGKMLSVVELEIKENAVVPLHEVFAAMARRAAVTAMPPRRPTSRFPFFLGRAGSRLPRGFPRQDARFWLPIEWTVGGDGDGDGDGFGNLHGNDGGGIGGGGGGGALTAQDCEDFLTQCLNFADKDPDPESASLAKAACWATYAGCIALTSW